MLCVRREALWLHLPVHFIQSYHPGSCPARPYCDSTEMANSFPFGQYSQHYMRDTAKVRGSQQADLAGVTVG